MNFYNAGGKCTKIIQTNFKQKLKIIQKLKNYTYIAILQGNKK